MLSREIDPCLDLDVEFLLCSFVVVGLLAVTTTQHYPHIFFYLTEKLNICDFNKPDTDLLEAFIKSSLSD